MAIRLLKGQRIGGVEYPAATVVTGLSPEKEAALISGGDAVSFTAVDGLLPMFGRVVAGALVAVHPDTAADVPLGGGGGGTAEEAQDAAAAMLTAATHDGVSVAYNDGANTLALTNTDKGSAARTAHEAAADPHPLYLTAGEGNAAYAPIGHSHSGLAPAGGSAAQVLKKNSGTDYDYSWQADATGGGGGTSAGFPMTIDTSSTTDADPTTGRIRYNNATQASATILYIDDTDDDGTSLVALKTSASGNLIYIVSETTPTTYQTWQVPQITDASGYDKHTVALVAKSAANFANNEAVRVLLLPGLLSGLGAPAATLGVDGQRYYDASFGLFYKKAAGVWVPVGNSATFADATALAAAHPGVVWNIPELNNEPFYSDGTLLRPVQALSLLFNDVTVRHHEDDTTAEQSYTSWTLPANLPQPGDTLEIVGFMVGHDNATTKSVIVDIGPPTAARCINAAITVSSGAFVNARQSITLSQLNEAFGPPASNPPTLSTSAYAFYSNNFAVAQPIEWKSVFGALDNRSVTGLSRSSNVVTATLAADMNVATNGYVTLAGNTDAGAGTSFNGTFRVTGSTATTVTWNQAGANRTATALDGTLNKCNTLRQAAVYLRKGAP